MIKSLKEKIEIYLDYHEPLMMFSWYRKNKYEWEKQNIIDDFNKLRKTQKQKAKRRMQEKKLREMKKVRNKWKRRMENDTQN